MSTPDFAKPWFINSGGTPQIVISSHTFLWYPPQLKNRLGFINPGLTLIWEMEGAIYGISPVKPPPVVILWLMAIQPTTGI